MKPMCERHPGCLEAWHHDSRIARRARALHHQEEQAHSARTDRLLAALMGAQWVAVTAFFRLPSSVSHQPGGTALPSLTWTITVPVTAATALSILMAVFAPGRLATRYTTAAAQMVVSAALLHSAGFGTGALVHPFVSLALLAFYRDWKVLLAASGALLAVSFVRDALHLFNSMHGAAAIPQAGWLLLAAGVLGAGCVREARTLRRQAVRTAELEAANTRLSAVLSVSPAGILELDAQGQCVVTNDAWHSISGLSPERSRGSPWNSVLHPADCEAPCNGTAVMAPFPEDREFRLIRNDGKVRWIRGCSRKILDEDGQLSGIVMAVEDMTERRHAAETLHHNAFHDALTGLPNRTAFLENVRGALARHNRRPEYQFAVLFLDLDRFKIINDSLGHGAGDELLLQVAGRLKRCVREGDAVSRLGGDEFTILLDDLTDESDIPLVAQRILGALTEPFQVQSGQVFISGSIGVASGSGNYTKAEELVRAADIAMYRAKSEGGTRYAHFSPEMHDSLLARVRVESDMRQGLERGEFCLSFQPIVTLPGGEVSGFEALVRWRHPEHGIISPDQFIPVAEETGLIIPLGEFVLREACVWLAQLHASAPHGAAAGLCISVNLSARQLADPRFPELLRRTLADSGLRPDSLKLEITESTIMQNLEHAASVLGRLRELGPEIVLDDFGTGYSSLSYLHRFPVDTLKIDRSFISEVPGGSAEIVRGIIALAASLGLKVVAEGIETREQSEWLHPVGCHYGQGYFFARPLDSLDARTFAEEKLAGASGPLISSSSL